VVDVFPVEEDIFRFRAGGFGAAHEGFGHHAGVPSLSFRASVKYGNFHVFSLHIAIEIDVLLFFFDYDPDSDFDFDFDDPINKRNRADNCCISKYFPCHGTFRGERLDPAEPIAAYKNIDPQVRA
jgi:hypothetical protein